MQKVGLEGECFGLHVALSSAIDIDNDNSSSRSLLGANNTR